MEEKETNTVEKKPAPTLTKHQLLNLCVICFTGVMTVVALITFFFAIVSDSNPFGNSIASLYVLCMLLAAPTLKVFMDKCELESLKRLNTIALVCVFVAILIMAVTVFIDLAV